jgi:predicted dehydrogenase
MRALEAGKHVFVENHSLRPRTRRVLIRTAYERDLVLMPGHTFLYSPPVVRIRD